MPLRFDLAPHERLYIGRSVLTNHTGRTFFILEGDTPVLRAKDVISIDSHSTSTERLYACLQNAYLREDMTRPERQDEFVRLVAEIHSSNAVSVVDLPVVVQLVSDGNLYKALRILKRHLSRMSFSEDRAALADAQS